MNDEERRRFESLESLRRAAYESFDSRRSYEWKLSLAIWTAEAIALVALLQPTKAGEVFPLNRPWGWAGALAVAVVLVILHCYLSDGLAKSNANDKAEARHFRDEMEKMVNLEQVVKTPFERRDDEGTRGWRQWSHLGQIGITALLAAAAALIIVLRS